MSLDPVTSHPSPDAAQAKGAPPPKSVQASPSQRQGRALEMPTPEPWPEPVDGVQLLGDLVKILQAHVKMQPGSPLACALWVLHCHAFQAWQISPRLTITSPEKRCGKTTLLTVLGGLVPKPLSTSNLTTAALFRAVEQWQPTLLIDEADTFLAGKEEMRGVLNSGFTKAGAQVVRVVGENLEPSIFSTWTPLAIAAIGRLPDTLLDRSIVLELRRKLPSECVTPLRVDRMGHLHELARKAARWALDHAEALAEADPEVPGFLHDRAADCWRPLLAIADAAGGPWPKEARDAIALIQGDDEADDEGSAALMLLADLKSIFDQDGSKTLPTEVLIERLCGADFEERPWSSNDPYGHPISPRQLAEMLRPFGVRPKTIRFEARTAKGYARSSLEDPWRRYLPTLQP